MPELQPVPSVFITVLLTYLILMGIIGYVSYQKTTSVREFFTMGGSAGFIMLALSYMATQYSMSTFMGAPGAATQSGWPFIGIVANIALGMAVPAFLVGTRLMQLGHKLEIYTLPDYLGHRYYSHWPRLLGAAAILLFLLPSAGAQVLGFGIIWELFTGYPANIGVIIAVIVVTAYCWAGGVRGVQTTDAIQAILMIGTTLALIIAVVFFSGHGSFADLVRAAAERNPGQTSMPGAPVPAITYRYTASQLFLFTIFTIGLPQLITRFLTVNSYRKVIQGSIISGAAMWVVVMTMLTIGAVGQGIFPVDASQVDAFIPTLIGHFFPPVVASFFLAGLIAAGMSTIDSMMVVISGAAARDIYHQVINPKADDAKVLNIIRAMTIVIGFALIYIGIARPGTIWELIVFTFSSFGVISVAVVLGIRWKRTTKEAAIIGLLAGQIYAIVATLNPPLAFGFIAGIPAAALTLVLMVVISLVTPPPPPRVMIDHFTD